LVDFNAREAQLSTCLTLSVAWAGYGIEGLIMLE
jgi:hypothetical protein